MFTATAIGISVDEIGRMRDSDVRYMRNIYPLLDLRWRHSDCVAFLTAHGLGDTPKSSCLGRPFHSDAWWQALKDESPTEWADAVAFDGAIRHGSARANADGHPLRGAFYLHHQRAPLDEVVFRPRAQEPEDAPGCGPWTCPHPVAFGPAGPGGEVA